MREKEKEKKKIKNESARKIIRIIKNSRERDSEREIKTDRYAQLQRVLSLLLLKLP